MVTYHKKNLTRAVWTLCFGLITLLGFSGTALANPIAVLDPDPIYSVVHTFLINFPINFILLAGLMWVGDMIWDMQEISIEPKKFMLTMIITVLLLSLFGAIVDVTVIGHWMFSITGIITGLILIGLSFFIAAKIILKQSILTSGLVAIMVTIANLITWRNITPLYSVKLSSYSPYLVFIVTFWLFYNWYDVEYQVSKMRSPELSE